MRGIHNIHKEHPYFLKNINMFHLKALYHPKVLLRVNRKQKKKMQRSNQLPVKYLKAKEKTYPVKWLAGNFISLLRTNDNWDMRIGMKARYIISL